MKARACERERECVVGARGRKALYSAGKKQQRERGKTKKEYIERINALILVIYFLPYSLMMLLPNKKRKNLYGQWPASTVLFAAGAAHIVHLRFPYITSPFI